MISLKCIWMECGYVEYKLCDRNFDCENCPFDKAIKTAIKVGEKNQSIDTFGDDSNVNQIPNQIKITENHLWLIKKGEHFTIGLDDFAQKFFDAGCSIFFPLIGSNLLVGKTFLWIIGSFGAIGFQSPISGTVRWINEKVKRNPQLFFEASAYSIELVKVESDDGVINGKIYDFDERNNLVYQDNLLIREFLLKKFSPTSKTHITLPDGGEFIKSYLKELSNQDFIQLLKLIFNKKI